MIEMNKELATSLQKQDLLFSEEIVECGYELGQPMPSYCKSYVLKK